jgi:hypothetical protein
LFVDSVQGNTSQAAQVAEVQAFGSAGAITPTAPPAGFGDGQHTVTATGVQTPAGHDLDLYFLGSDCSLKGSTATAVADESAVLPGGTTYLLTQLFTGANVPVTITAVDAG